MENEPENADDLRLTVCGRDCSAPVKDEVYGSNESGGNPVAQGYCREDCHIYRFDLNDTADLPNLLTLQFSNAGKTVKITYCEVDVTP